MTTRYWTTGVCGMALALLTGCRMGPDYRRPDLDPPAVFRDQPTVSEAASLADQPWWGVFGDDVLRQLVEQAIASNLDLRAAVWRIEQARAGVTIARSALFPQANYQGGGARAGTPAVGDPGAAVTLNSFNAALSAAWELDIWGRLRRGTEAAQAQCLAAEEVRRGVLLSLVGQVAQGYFTLRALDRELEVTRQTVDAYEKTLGMFNRRYEGGVDTLLSVERARANLAGAAAQAADIERSIAAQENSLCLLLALPPGPMPRG
ncbi:MAG: TolC family protein, partial [bacterium]